MRVPFWNAFGLCGCLLFAACCLGDACRGVEPHRNMALFGVNLFSAATNLAACFIAAKGGR